MYCCFYVIHKCKGNERIWAWGECDNIAVASVLLQMVADSLKYHQHELLDETDIAAIETGVFPINDQYFEDIF